MNQRDDLEYHTNITDLDAGEYNLQIVVQSATENDLVERNDVIGLSDSQPVTVAAAEEEPEAEPLGDEQDETVTDDDSPGFGITVALVSLMIVLVLRSDRFVDR